MLKCSKVNKKIKDNNTTLPTCQTENLNMKNKDITNLNLTDKSMKGKLSFKIKDVIVLKNINQF